ncbi:MAG TPA: TadE/TadG family type IV pilus assembly protein [Caulobacteraceae bacterium]|nr:TadE/TadG family type IV pilus assembly protein [Caulobacteraceae bacterium]
MIEGPRHTERLQRLARAFIRDRRAAAAVDLALLALPFMLLLLATMQLGMYYMTQVALDAATVKTAESLRAVFGTGTTPVTPSGSALKTSIVSGSGTGITATGLIVEIQPLANLNSGAVTITDGLTNYGTAWTPLVLRANYTFQTFVPGFATNWTVNSSAIVRRQGQ